VERDRVSTATAESSRQRDGVLLRAWRVFSGMIVGLGVVVAALMLVPGLLGYQRYVITSGSMTGTIDRGSLIYDRVVPASLLKRGDIITYTPPLVSGVREPITHRIVGVGHDRLGHPVFRTKGDANPAADAWTFRLEKPTQARVAFHVPYVGFVLAALSERKLRMLVIGLPALLIALSIIARLWHDAGEEVDRRRALPPGALLEPER